MGQRIALTSIILQVIPMNLWIHPDWQSALAERGLNSLDEFWTAEAELVETPNEGRGGTSGVSLLSLPDKNGQKTRLFLKRQVDHLTHGLGPIGRYPTARREFHNLQSLQKAGFQVPEIVGFGERRTGKGWQAILLTRELTERVSLWELLHSGITGESRWAKEKRALIRAIASVVRRLHQSGYRHGSLYPKHIFVDPKRMDAEPALIDLEKMRKDALSAESSDDGSRRIQSPDAFIQPDRPDVLSGLLSRMWLGRFPGQGMVDDSR